ncbi:agmatine deiminase family protein [Aquimarina hainanensis]|uniref:Agmatine deiminase family protein n=1 Tax=Aquimarina hainanensis TaxID=1578017 RepID=A0ABW5N8G8_9FLAO
MRKINLILAIVAIFFTGVLKAQEVFTSKEKKLIIEKYTKGDSNFNPSPAELEVIYNYIKNKKLTKEELEEYKEKSKRKISNDELEKYRKANSKKSRSSASNATMELPADARFPGEFEEVQGIFVTYPYHANAPDFTYYGKFFRELINGIQQAGVKVYINVRKQSDKDILIRHFREQGTPLTNYQFLVNPSDQFWTRDFGPINFYYGADDKIGWVDLNYGGRGKDDQLTPLWAKEMAIDYTYMPIRFEGGNTLMDGQQTLTTSSAVFENNGLDYSKAEVENMLKKSFNLKKLYVLDRLIDDGGTGHVDLYLDMTDENTFVYTKQPMEMANISEYVDYQNVLNNIEFLEKQTSSAGKPYAFNTIPFPTRDDGSIFDTAKSINGTNRTYSNHLIVNKTIIQPVFNDGQTGNIEGDRAALDILKKKYPGYKIITVDGRVLQGLGGSIHCVTKEFAAENPVRFKHYAYRGEVNRCQSSYPIDAVITNKSGIKQATLFSRVKGTTTWTQTRMTKEAANHWKSAITLSSASSNDMIEYYLSATSNNGKTMTYPMTGAEGGAYTFWCASSCSKEITAHPSYKESFESSLGDWIQDTADDLDWKLSTMGQTEPINAADGDYYLFINNSEGTSNKQAILKSPCLNLSGASFAKLTFKHYNYGGNDTGSLYLEASDDNGFTWEKIWQTPNNQTTTWSPVTVDLKEYIGETVQLRFNRTTGTNSRAGIAIDAISISTLETQAPTTPLNLAVSNVAATSLTLTWAAATDNVKVTEYLVYEGTKKVATVKPDYTKFNATALTPETVYTYTVRAKDVAGNISSASNIVNVTTSRGTAPNTACDKVPDADETLFYEIGDRAKWKPWREEYKSVFEFTKAGWERQFKCNATGSDTQAPTAPANLTAGNVTKTTIDLSWGASTDNVGVTGYEVYQGNTMIGTVTGTRYQAVGLTAGTAYTFKVLAKDAAGNKSRSSNTVTATTISEDTQAPTAPANLTAGNVTQTTIDLSWVASTDNVGVTGYEIYQDDVLKTSGTTTSYQVMGLTPNTSYRFKVRAKDAAGNYSAFSNIVSVKTIGDTGGDCQKVTGVVASDIKDVSATIDWNVADGTTTYIVEYKKTTANAYTIVEATSNTLGLRDLSPETTYQLRIKYTCKGATGDICDGVAPWSSGVVYQPGDKVVYNDTLYQKNSSNGWDNLGRCGTTGNVQGTDAPYSDIITFTTKKTPGGGICDGVEPWRSGVVYQPGDKVVYNNTLYQKNASGGWDNLGACNGSKKLTSLASYPPSAIELIIYQEPFSGTLSISLPEALLKSSSYRIFDVTGKVIMSGEKAKKIDVETIENGMYILKITSGKNSYVKRFLKH